MTERNWQPWPLREDLRKEAMPRPSISYGLDLANSPYSVEVDMDMVVCMMHDMGFNWGEISKLGIVVDKKATEGSLGEAMGHQYGSDIYLHTDKILLDARSGLRPWASNTLGRKFERFEEEEVLKRASQRASRTVAHELAHYYQCSYWPRGTAEEPMVYALPLAFTASNTFNAALQGWDVTSKVIFGAVAFVVSGKIAHTVEAKFSPVEYNARRVSAEMMQVSRWQNVVSIKRRESLDG